MFDEHAKTLNTCLTCASLCQGVCPVFIEEGTKTHSPWGLMQLINNVRKKQIPFDQDVSNAIYHCLSCRACTEYCAHHFPVPDILEQARQAAVSKHTAPPEIMEFIERFHRHNNPFSKDLLHKLESLLPAKYIKHNSNIVYFPACTTIAKCPEIIRDTFALFEKCGIDFVGLYNEPVQCCGYPLLSVGAEYEFVDLAEIAFHALRKYKLIITGCPACAHTLKHSYAKYDFNFENTVVTINDFLTPYLDHITPPPTQIKVPGSPIASPVMFHDPCYLSRYLNQTHKPREMIARVSGCPPVEFYNNRGSVPCCGQGGCYPLLARDHANAITTKRLAECYEKNIKTVVSQCPACVYKLRQNGKRLVVKDLITYLNDLLEKDAS